MNAKIRVQLSTMMFLQFFIWGAWAVTLGTYLGTIGFSATDIGSAYSTTAWAAIVSPFFIGMIADRFFAAQKVLAFLHIVGAGLMYYASTIQTPGPFFWVLLAYALCYMPTLALVNAISFNQMTDPQSEFPAVRLLGTVGWIVAGQIIGWTSLEKSVLPLQMAAGVSLAMGVFSWTLPNTPPRGASKRVSIRDILGLDALRLMKDPSFAIFVLSSLFICVPLAFYYAFTNPFLVEAGVEGSAWKQSLGQVSEVVFMFLMPFFFRRLGVKKMLIAGMAAWVLRYVLFAYGNNASLVAMFYGGILLHGICYDFFFVTGQIYVDNKAPKAIQASAQGFISLVTYGVGMVIGSKIAGLVVDHYATKNGDVTTHNWQQIWLIPAAMAAIVVVVFAVLFRERATAKSTAPSPASATN